MVIDNDGIHPPTEKTETVTLKGGIHLIRVSYFQGLRYNIALVLRVAELGEEWRIFSAEEFHPPTNPEDWNGARVVQPKAINHGAPGARTLLVRPA